MKQIIRATLVGAIALGVAGILLVTLSSFAASVAPSTPLLTPTATYCPTTTPEPFWVDPVTSPTRLLSQDVRAYLGNCEAVTVSAESGTFATTDGCYPAPALVDVALQPNTVHHLQVSGKVRRIVHDGCAYGGYTLSTRQDRFGAPLVITQQFTVTSNSYFPFIWQDLSTIRPQELRP